MKIENFVITRGKAKIDKDSIVYEPDIVKDLNAERKKLITDINTDFFFSNGNITFRFIADSPKSGILVLLSPQNQENHSLLVGHSFDQNAFVIIPEGDLKDKFYNISGSLSNFDLTKEHVMSIESAGSKLKLLINNVIICEAAITLRDSPIKFRLFSDQKIIIKDFKITPHKPKVFIVMQFSKEYNELYEEVIRPACESFGLECIRADEFYTSTPILNDIINIIKTASIIVAEITPDNPNVFYEIGYSHAINKPTILLCDVKREKLPFDISGFRTLFYENTIAGKNKVDISLKKFIQNIIYT